jgi:hypothetical protein
VISRSSSHSNARASVGDINIRVDAGASSSLDVTSLIGLIGAFHQSNPGVPLVRHYEDYETKQVVRYDSRECKCVNNPDENRRYFQAQFDCQKEGRTWITWEQNPDLPVNMRCSLK